MTYSIINISLVCNLTKKKKKKNWLIHITKGDNDILSEKTSVFNDTQIEFY